MCVVTDILSMKNCAVGEGSILVKEHEPFWMDQITPNLKLESFIFFFLEWLWRCSTILFYWQKKHLAQALETMW